MNSTAYILSLANSFPCLQPKLRDYHPKEFDSLEFEKMSRVWSTGERFCALFVCAVWNNRNLNNRWDGEPFERYVDFDVVDAMGTLSSDNRKPIVDWIAKPVWV